MLLPVTQNWVAVGHDSQNQVFVNSLSSAKSKTELEKEGPSSSALVPLGNCAVVLHKWEKQCSWLMEGDTEQSFSLWEFIPEAPIDLLLSPAHPFSFVASISRLKWMQNCYSILFCQADPITHIVVVKLWLSYCLHVQDSCEVGKWRLGHSSRRNGYLILKTRIPASFLEYCFDH